MTRREGRLVDDGFLFEEKGKSTLRFRPRADGGLAATWTSPDGKTSMDSRSAPHRPAVFLPPRRRAIVSLLSPNSGRCCRSRRR